MNKREAEKAIRGLADAVIVRHDVPDQAVFDELEAAGYKLERLKLRYSDGIRVTYPDGSMGFATRIHDRNGKQNRCTVYTMEDMHRYESCTRMLVEADKPREVYDADAYADGIEADGLRNQLKQACEQMRHMMADAPEPEPEPMPVHEPEPEPMPGQDEAVPLECYAMDEQPAHEPMHEPERRAAHETVLEWLARPHMGIAVTRKNERSCWWVTGDTKPRREQLKAMGFRWSPNKRAWYLRPQTA